MAKFINFEDIYNRWKLADLCEIVCKIKAWTDNNGLPDVELVEVQDNRLSDKENQRIDVVIRYVNKDNILMEQKLLILKDEVIDGKTFHRRSREFYKGNV